MHRRRILIVSKLSVERSLNGSLLRATLDLDSLGIVLVLGQFYPQLYMPANTTPQVSCLWGRKHGGNLIHFSQQ